MAPQAATVSTDALECTVCLSVFVCPLTLACGHTFCRDCCEGALNRGRGSKCPLCRTDIDASRLPSETVALRQLVQQCFPEQYAAAVVAKAEARRAAAAAAATATPTADDQERGGSGIPWSQLPTGGAVVHSLPILAWSPQLLWPHQPVRMMIEQPQDSQVVQQLLQADVKLIGVHASLALAVRPDEARGDGSASRSTGLEPGTLGTLVAIAQVEEHCDSQGRTQYALLGRGVSRYEIIPYGARSSTGEHMMTAAPEEQAQQEDGTVGLKRSNLTRLFWRERS